jgi:class 3 adenylate cyclase
VIPHAFLFADLRDYTRFVETHGDRAGAALLDRYRELVRGAVAASDDAEIRTEATTSTSCSVPPAPPAVR